MTAEASGDTLMSENGFSVIAGSGDPLRTIRIIVIRSDN